MVTGQRRSHCQDSLVSRGWEDISILAWTPLRFRHNHLDWGQA